MKTLNLKLIRKKVNHNFVLVLSIIVLNCCASSENETSKCSDFEILNFDCDNSNYSFLSNQPFFSVKKVSDSIIIETNELVCNYREVFKKRDSYWFSDYQQIKKKKNIKYPIIQELKKYCFNDTLVTYNRAKISLKAIEYNPTYYYISLYTPNRKIIFFHPNFEEEKFKLDSNDLKLLFDNSPIIIEENIKRSKTGIYKDITKKNILTSNIERYTLFYELEGASRYFLEVDQCNSFKKIKLEYGERLGNGLD